MLEVSENQNSNKQANYNLLDLFLSGRQSWGMHTRQIRFFHNIQQHVHVLSKVSTLIQKLTLENLFIAGLACLKSAFSILSKALRSLAIPSSIRAKEFPCETGVWIKSASWSYSFVPFYRKTKITARHWKMRAKVSAFPIWCSRIWKSSASST